MWSHGKTVVKGKARVPQSRLIGATDPAPPIVGD
jgi:hypothetical protein